MEIGRYTLRQSIFCWKVVKMWVRIGATYLLFTALTEKNVRIDTARHQDIFLMTDISSCRPILTSIARMDLDLLIYIFLKPSGAAKSVENFDVRQSRSDNLTRQYFFCSILERESPLIRVSRAVIDVLQGLELVERHIFRVFRK